MGIKPPSPYEIKINKKNLDIEYKDMEDYVNLQREKWKAYGFIIMCDGWTGPTKLSIINFMVYCKGSIIFLKSVDVSDNIKDNKYIYGLLKQMLCKSLQFHILFNIIITFNAYYFPFITY